MKPPPAMLELREAREVALALAAELRVQGVETIACADAVQRVLATDLIAPAAVPGFVHSAMDGFAVRGDDLDRHRPTRLRLRGSVFAGSPGRQQLAAGDCLRIMTGAALPAGADTVVIKENAQVDGEQVELAAGTPPGSNVRAADDDYAAGSLALSAGVRLRAEQLGVLASFGLTRIAVRRRPRVALITTGDELRAAGHPLAYGQRHDSNGPMLAALLPQLGAEVISRIQVGDHREQLRAALLQAAETADLVLSTGGVSAGEADLLPGLLAEIGRIAFWKVRMRPGMPVLCGRIGAAQFFGLPGNPVSVYATTLMLVRPVLAAWLHCKDLDPLPSIARLDSAIDKRHDRLEFRRASLRVDEQGVQWVQAHRSVSSGAMRSVVESDCLLELAAEARSFEPGETVPVHRLP